MGLGREGSFRRQGCRLAFGGPGWDEWPVAEDHCSFPWLQGGQAEAGWDAEWAKGPGGGGEVRTFLPGYIMEAELQGEVHLNTFQ